jgi:hypothetical protein
VGRTHGRTGNTDSHFSELLDPMSTGCWIVLVPLPKTIKNTHGARVLVK